MKILDVCLPLTLVLAAGCAAGLDDADEQDEQDVTTRYVHLSELDGLDYDRWYTVRDKTKPQPDRVTWK